MKNERQANMALVAYHESNQWKGSLGEKRQPHQRPSMLRRLVARFIPIHSTVGGVK